MTVVDLAPPLRAPSLASALGALRARGMRVSTARRQMLAELYTAEGPVSAEALAERLPGADLASVYRNLVVLEEVGLVRHVHLGHGPGRYALAATTVEFVTCDRCGAHEAFDPSRIDAARDLIERELGYRPHFTHFPIVGVCTACQDKENGHAHS